MNKISPKEWEAYENNWKASIKKHFYEEEYALNLMDISFDNLRMLPFSYIELAPVLQKFHEIWGRLLTPVVNRRKTYARQNT